MSNVVKKYNIYISSRMRYSGTPESFTITLNKPINLSSDKTEFQAYITNVELPYAFHQINATNNTFQVEVLVNNIPVSLTTATITNGNYNILTLLAEVKTAIYTATGLPNLVYDFTYNKTTGKVTLSQTDPIYINYKIRLYFTNNTIGRMMGFNTTTLFFYNSPATSPLTVNVNPINQIFLRSDIVASNGDSESLESFNENSNVLAKIPIKVQPNSYIYSTSNFDERIFLSVPQLTIINFYLTAGNSKTVLDNQSQDWSFVLTILEVEKPDEFGFTKVSSIIQPMVDLGDLEKQKEGLIKELTDLKDKLEKEN